MATEHPLRLVLYLGDRALARRVAEWILADPERGLVAGVCYGCDEPDPAWQADLGVSVQYRRILPETEIRRYPRGVVNLHTGYLPFNRGAMPNVWPIIDHTPAGVTLHYLNAGVDTGPIVDRRKVDVLPTDTGETLYRRLEAAAFDLFVDAWPRMVRPVPPCGVYQDPLIGTTHRSHDVRDIDRLYSLKAGGRAMSWDDQFTREVIELLRARTFTGYPGCYFVTEAGRRVYVRVSLEDGGSDG